MNQTQVRIDLALADNQSQNWDSIGYAKLASSGNNSARVNNGLPPDATQLPNYKFGSHTNSLPRGFSLDQNGSDSQLRVVLEHRGN